jgi:hypothetical protein
MGKRNRFKNLLDRVLGEEWNLQNSCWERYNKWLKPLKIQDSKTKLDKPIELVRGL